MNNFRGGMFTNYNDFIQVPSLSQTARLFRQKETQMHWNPVIAVSQNESTCRQMITFDLDFKLNIEHLITLIVLQLPIHYFCNLIFLAKPASENVEDLGIIA